MYKKQIALVITLIMLLAVMVPGIYATEAPSTAPLDQSELEEIIKDSDRYEEIDEINRKTEEHPFDAETSELLQEGVDIGEYKAFSIDTLQKTVDVDVFGEVAYDHVYYISEEIGQRLAGSEEEIETMNYIVDVFEDLGYEPEVQPFSYTRNDVEYDSNNVIAVKEGRSSEEVIIGAHYDSIGEGSTGADDNASGVGVMLEAAKHLKDMDTEYTIRFIAFGAEEVGLRGSRHYAEQMSDEEAANTMAMINLDSLIAGDMMYVYSGMDHNEWVREQALDLADYLGLDVQTNPGLNPDYPEGKTGDWSDHAPFRGIDIPVAYFEATNWEIGDLDGYQQSEEYGTIFHTDMDNLDFLEDAFGKEERIMPHLETFSELLVHLAVEIDPPGMSVSNHKVSLTEAREIHVQLDLGYIPGNVEDIDWYFGGLPFDNWQQFRSESGEYDGDPFIYFEEEPYMENGRVQATIKFDLVYTDEGEGYNNLSRRDFRVRIEDLIGDYDLRIIDSEKNLTIATPMNLNVYDSYRTYDEIKPELERIIDETKEDRYMEYVSLGNSYEGREIPFVKFARDEQDLIDYQEVTLPLMLEDPHELLNQIDNGGIDDYKPVIWFHNIHPDETPGVDAQIDVLEMLTTQDEITFNTLEGDLETDIEDLDEIEVTLDVNDLLDNFIVLFNITQNPDGRYHTERGAATGLDMNRDLGFQTQQETRYVTEAIAEWSPMVFNDLHGFVTGFLIEPCTPPHDPNFEYDLLMDGMIPHAHAMGRAGISNVDAPGHDSYFLPRETWDSGWDDATIVYTAMYGMAHGAAAHTVEMPELNQYSNDLTVYAVLGSLNYAMENKERLFSNQLEIYRRAVDGEDAAEHVDQWFVDPDGNSIGRPREEGESFFPDYFVIPRSMDNQRNVLAAHEMAEHLLRNGVKVEQVTTEITINDTVYPEGTFVVPMKQAKRNLANAFLYEGNDVSAWPAMYAEVVQNFHDLRGFDRDEIRVADAFEGYTAEISTVEMPETIVNIASDYYVINNRNNDVIRAVNNLLGAGKEVKMILDGGDDYLPGDFVVSRRDLMRVAGDYYLEVVPYDGNGITQYLMEPKVRGYSNEVIFVLNDLLEFNMVSDLSDANVIADGSGVAHQNGVTPYIEDGVSYVGIGGWAINSFAETGLLEGLERGRNGTSYEGVLRAEIDTNHYITGNYTAEDMLYNRSASWIDGVPTTSRVLASIVDRDDHFKAGWWPENDVVRGQDYILIDEVGDADITIFANHIANRGHPSHQFRMLANAIYGSNMVPAFPYDQLEVDVSVVNGMVNLTVNLTNDTGVLLDGTLVVQAFNEDGTVYHFETEENVVIGQGEEHSFSFAEGIGAQRVEVFLWESLDSLKPYAAKESVDF